MLRILYINSHNDMLNGSVCDDALLGDGYCIKVKHGSYVINNRKVFNLRDIMVSSRVKQCYEDAVCQFL